MWWKLYHRKRLHSKIPIFSLPGRDVPRKLLLSKLLHSLKFFFLLALSSLQFSRTTRILFWGSIIIWGYIFIKGSHLPVLTCFINCTFSYSLAIPKIVVTNSFLCRSKSVRLSTSNFPANSKRRVNVMKGSYFLGTT